MSPANTDELEGGKLQQKQLPQFYMRMTEANVDARMGKLSPGQIVVLPEDKALRWLNAGVAVQTNVHEYEEQQDRKSQQSSAAQERFRAMNDGHAMWDVSTYRDVLTAPEHGLRLAYEAGIPLVNIHQLRDENGFPISPEADIEEILDARDLLHPDGVAPLAAHHRSSVMGGGSPYGEAEPLSPQHRDTMRRIADQERMAQGPATRSYTANDAGARSRQMNQPGSERANRATRRSAGRRTAGKVSEQGRQEANDQGLPTPESASGEQLGNAAGKDD